MVYSSGSAAPRVPCAASLSTRKGVGKGGEEKDTERDQRREEVFILHKILCNVSIVHLSSKF